jgi:anti-sigma B factor antagonist
MKVKDQLEGDVVVIQFSGKIMASDELTSFHGRVHYYLDLNKRRFVIDMEHVEWMNSTGLGALIAAYTSITKAGGRFALVNITNIQNLLNITQLVRVFDTYDSRSEAFKAVAA